MSLQVLKLKDLIESPSSIPDPNNMPDTNKIYKLRRVIDVFGESIGFPEEVEVVVEVEDIANG